MNDYLVPLGASLATMSAAAVLLWLLSLRVANSSIVDIFWGPLFLSQAIVYFILTPDGFMGRKVLMLVLVAIWAIRLGTHIATRGAGKGEDSRYAAWREEEGERWWWFSFFKVFALQGLLAWIIGVPLLAAMIGGPDAFTLLDGIGVAVWLFGFAYEAIGDYQLAAFLRDPDSTGQTMRSGLWRTTRHPNYFGDAAQWLAYWLIAAAAGGWWTIFGPLLMTFLLVRISGVGKLEQTIADRRDGYREYMEGTSAFVPWFPGRGKPGS